MPNKFFKRLLHPTKPYQRGFTIVELSLYMAIFSLLLVVITEIFTSILSVKITAEANAHVDQDVRYVLSRLAYDVQRASTVTVPATLGATSSSLSLVINGSTYSYAVSGNTLQLTEPTGSYQMNGSDTEVTQLSFRRLGNSGGAETVQVQLTVRPRNATNDTQSRTIQTTLGTR